MPPKKPPKIFFGWWINIVTGIINGFAYLYPAQGASLLFKPIATDLGLDRTKASMAMGFGGLIQGPVFASTGWLTDRFGPRWIVTAGMALLGMGIILLSFVQSGLAYILVWSLMIAPGATLGVTIAIDTMLANWFIRKRGLAFSIRFSLVSLMAILGLPLLGWLIESQGWRMVSWLWGGLVLLCIPVLLYFLKAKRPEYYGMLPDGASPSTQTLTTTAAVLAHGRAYAAEIQETDFTLSEAMKTSSFWMLNVGWLMMSIIFPAFNLHVIPFITDRGIDPVVAGAMLSMMMLFMLPSRFFGSIVADRLKKDYLKYLVAGSLFLPTLGIAIFLLFPTSFTVYLLLALYGLGAGAYTPTDILLRARYFGRKAYGSIQGLPTLIFAPLTFSAPIFTGWIYDTTGDYTPAFTVFVVLGIAGVVTLSLMHIPRIQHTQ